MSVFHFTRCLTTPIWTRQRNDVVGFTLPRNGRVCSDHFRVGDYHELLYSKKPRSRRRLKGNAVPSVSLGTMVCVATTQTQGSNEAAPSNQSCEIGAYNEVLDDSMVQPGCESMDVGANVDVGTCCRMLHDPELVVDDSTAQPGCESMDVGANVDGDTCCTMLHDPEQVWTTQQASLVEACKGRELHLLGDGRCGSPGHSAKYLTYTLMDADSKKVLNFTQVQVGQVHLGKGVLMDKDKWAWLLFRPKDSLFCKEATKLLWGRAGTPLTSFYSCHRTRSTQLQATTEAPFEELDNGNLSDVDSKFEDSDDEGMSRNHFEKLRNNLHIVDVNYPDAIDRLWNVRPPALCLPKQ
ncbi:hypothetical protein MTO96_045086, partial [Rhipicephalus appendiculatus]